MPERTKPRQAQRQPGRRVDADRARRLFVDDGRITRLRVAGEQLPDGYRDAVVGGTIRLSTTTQSELGVQFADLGYRLLGEKRISLGAHVAYQDLEFKIATVDAGGDGLAFTARSATWRRLRRHKGPDMQRDTSPTDYFRRRLRKLGIRFVTEDTPRRRHAGRHKGETDAKALARYAVELGFILFEVAGTVYFGRPTWLADRAARLVVRPGAPFLRNGFPALSASVDDPRRAVSLALELEPEVGDRIRPGMAIDLVDVPYFPSTYLVDDVAITLDAATAVTVNASTPINPVPQPPGATATTAGGGSRRLGDLLRYVGFKGDGLRVATGVAVAESRNADGNPDANALGDLNLVDAKWGPSCSIFQIRSLKHPEDYDGVDRLRVRDRLMDPIFNARVAFKISNGGRDWSAWTTFTSGDYQAHVDEGDRRIAHWDGLPAPDSASASAGTRKGMVWPTASHTITTAYHVAGSWAAGYHTGVDIAAPTGAHVWAAHAGRVVHAGPYGDYGNTVKVRVEDHDVMYCHGQTGTIAAKVGQDVQPKTPLFHADSTGRAFGSHLHFEVRPAGGDYGDDVDPMKWLP